MNGEFQSDPLPTESVSQKRDAGCRPGKPLQCHSMTARDALEQATAAPLGERLRRFEITCGPRGGCEREPVMGNTGRWTWCAACLTVYDDYGTPVNPIPEVTRTRH
jgi:hypothetical protein